MSQRDVSPSKYEFQVTFARGLDGRQTARLNFRNLEVNHSILYEYKLQDGTWVSMCGTFVGSYMKGFVEDRWHEWLAKTILEE